MSIEIWWSKKHLSLMFFMQGVKRYEVKVVLNQAVYFLYFKNAKKKNNYKLLDGARVGGNTDCFTFPLNDKNVIDASEELDDRLDMLR
jgi:hypothetical protein